MTKVGAVDILAADEGRGMGGRARANGEVIQNSYTTASSTTQLVASEQPLSQPRQRLAVQAVVP